VQNRLHGPGRSGKTTNLHYIYGRVPETRRGRMVSLATQTDRTLFFDFLPIDLGQISGSPPGSSSTPCRARSITTRRDDSCCRVRMA